jgi:hypothetical protein
VSRRTIILFLAVVAGVCLAGTVFVVHQVRESPAASIRALPARIRKLKTVSMSMRSSLRDTAGTVRYTDSSAIADFQRDEAFVALPGVLHDQPLQLVSQGLTMYVTVPSDRQASLPAARWLRVDTASRATARGASFGPIPDPFSVLLSLTGATGRVHHLGTRTLDGEKFRVEQVSVEPKVMAGHIGADDVASADKLGGISLRWTADVWLDGKKRLRRIELSTSIRQHGQPAGTIVLDLRVGAFDDPVQIGIPPADAVRPVPSAAEALRLVGGT